MFVYSRVSHYTTLIDIHVTLMLMENCLVVSGFSLCGQAL